MTKKNIVKCKECAKEDYHESTGNLWFGWKHRKTAHCPYSGAERASEFISGFINL